MTAAWAPYTTPEDRALVTQSLLALSNALFELAAVPMWDEEADVVAAMAGDALAARVLPP